MQSSSAKGVSGLHWPLHPDVGEPFFTKQLLWTHFVLHFMWHKPEPAVGQQRPDTAQYPGESTASQLRVLQRSWRPGSPSSPPRVTTHPVCHPSFYIYMFLLYISIAPAGGTCCNQVNQGLADNCSSAGPPHQRNRVIHRLHLHLHLYSLDNEGTGGS